MDNNKVNYVTTKTGEPIFPGTSCGAGFGDTRHLFINIYWTADLHIRIINKIISILSDMEKVVSLPPPDI